MKQRPITEAGLQGAAEAFARIMERRHGGTWLPVVRRKGNHSPAGIEPYKLGSLSVYRGAA